VRRSASREIDCERRRRWPAASIACGNYLLRNLANSAEWAPIDGGARTRSGWLRLRPSGGHQSGLARMGREIGVSAPLERDTFPGIRFTTSARPAGARCRCTPTPLARRVAMTTTCGARLLRSASRFGPAGAPTWVLPAEHRLAFTFRHGRRRTTRGAALAQCRGPDSEPLTYLCRSVAATAWDLLGWPAFGRLPAALGGASRGASGPSRRLSRAAACWPARAAEAPPPTPDWRPAAGRRASSCGPASFASSLVGLVAL
jgi:hypothetical protein